MSDKVVMEFYFALRLPPVGYPPPFLPAGPAYSHLGYADAKRALGAVGAQIAEREQRQRAQLDGDSSERHSTVQVGCRQRHQ